MRTYLNYSMTEKIIIEYTRNRGESTLWGMHSKLYPEMLYSEKEKS